MSYCIFCMNEIEQGAAECPHCGKKQDYEVPAHQLMPGTMLRERFLIGAALGEGGFGITYIGRDQQLDMRVAVKEYFPNGYVNRTNTASPKVTISSTGDRKNFFETGRERFLREARVLARFSSEEGIVTVRDFFEENNTAYIVMEYLDGQTMKDYLSEHGTLTPEQTFELMRPVMRSLREVHKQGLIHRDIAPDNIMIVNGRVKLLDFGAARNMSSIANKSLSVVLKPGYAPEEQYRSRGNQGPWTDVYALAATMYKCITGETPDDSTQRVFDDELKTPSELGIDIDPRFEAAIMKGLAVSQMDRYQSIDDFLNALENGEETPAARETNRPAAAPRQVADDGYGTEYIEDEYANPPDSEGSSDRPAALTEPKEDIKNTFVADAAAGDNKKTAPKLSTAALISIIAGAVVLVAGIVLLFVLLGGKGNGRNAKEEKGIKLSDNLYDTTFELDGVVYQLPMKFEKLASNGWTISESGYNDSTELAGYGEDTFRMSRNGATIEVCVYNNSGNARAIKNSIVYSVEGEYDSGGNIKLGKGIDCTSSVEEIIAAFGVPTERTDSSDCSVLKYVKAGKAGVKFFCYTEESGLKKYSTITVANINVEDENDTEINNAVPDYLAKYKAPSSLGNDLLSATISIGGDLYHLPAPLSAFLDNGWKLRQASDVIPAGDTNTISIERNGVWFYVDLINLASYQTVAENCAVYRVAIENDQGIPAELSGGIALNSTSKAEVESKTGSGFSLYDGYDYYSYNYSDYSRGYDFKVTIDVDKSSGKVRCIILSNKEWNY